VLWERSTVWPGESAWLIDNPGFLQKLDCTLPVGCDLFRIGTSRRREHAWRPDIGYFLGELRMSSVIRHDQGWSYDRPVQPSAASAQDRSASCEICVIPVCFHVLS